MTRINCVPVTELSGKHLVAEYRELPRVYVLATRAAARGEAPSSHGDMYTLGTGHVRFFYSRLGYVTTRHRALIAEMLARGYKPSHTHVNKPNVPRAYMRNWTPDETALAINRARIAERTKQ